MRTEAETSDTLILDLIRRIGPMNVSQLAVSMQVTATAVRQRLTRLTALGLIQRSVSKFGRGRPSHKYDLTEQGRRKTGSNFADLALALWDEVRSIENPEIRRGLLQRLSSRLAGMMSSRVQGEGLGERMEQVAEVFVERRMPFFVDRSGSLPVLQASACPYPDLAEKDRSICAVEKMMFSELLGEPVRLSECRLDGDSCCRFEPSSYDGPPRPSNGVN